MHVNDLIERKPNKNDPIEVEIRFKLQGVELRVITAKTEGQRNTARRRAAQYQRELDYYLSLTPTASNVPP